jgi:hypothetical protein
VSSSPFAYLGHGAARPGRRYGDHDHFSPRRLRAGRAALPARLRLPMGLLRSDLLAKLALSSLPPSGMRFEPRQSTSRSPVYRVHCPLLVTPAVRAGWSPALPGCGRSRVRVRGQGTTWLRGAGVAAAFRSARAARCPGRATGARRVSDGGRSRCGCSREAPHRCGIERGREGTLRTEAQCMGLPRAVRSSNWTAPTSASPPSPAGARTFSGRGHRSSGQVAARLWYR